MRKANPPFNSYNINERTLKEVHDNVLQHVSQKYLDNSRFQTSSRITVLYSLLIKSSIVYSCSFSLCIMFSCSIQY